MRVFVMENEEQERNQTRVLYIMHHRRGAVCVNTSMLLVGDLFAPPARPLVRPKKNQPRS
jgi:hypothetical protein